MDGRWANTQPDLMLYNWLNSTECVFTLLRIHLPNHHLVLNSSETPTCGSFETAHQPGRPPVPSLSKRTSIRKGPRSSSDSKRTWMDFGRRRGRSSLLRDRLAFSRRLSHEVSLFLSPSTDLRPEAERLAASFAISVQRACTNRPTDPSPGLRQRLSLRLPFSSTTRCLSTSTSPDPSSSAPPRASSRASPSGARTRLPRPRVRASAQRKRPRR